MKLTRTLFALMLLAGLAAAPGPAAAQEAVPRIDEAEAIFGQALSAFEAEDHGLAARRFRFVYDSYPLHRKTTAAILMAGKALYRAGDPQAAIDLLTEFRRSYPTSSYLDEADQTIRFARQALDAREDEPIQLGIALPLGSQDVAFTQTLFNGIRLAVDQHNRQAERRVRMVFRNTNNTAVGARNAVAELAGGADVIVGPLYSEEAEAAAVAAERAGVVLVAPLATDETVSAGRRYVFQANPTITARGAQTARRAVQELGVRRVGIVAEEGNSISERMAEGFEEEARRLGADVVFYELLPGPRAWADLTERVDESALRAAEAVYMPVSGRTAQSQIERVLDGFERLGVLPRVLGNSEFRDLPFRDQASDFGVLYADDFHVQESDAVRIFRQNYRQLADRDPDRLAYVGYDVTRFLLAQLVREDREPLPAAMRAAGRYQGLGMDIDFREGNANTALFFLHYRDGRTILEN